MNQIKKGYKQTKVGIIPEDWEVVKLGDIATFHKGKGISKNEISKEGIRCIRYGQLYTTYSEKIETIHSRTSLPINKLFLSKKNDVLIPASGETAIDLATASCLLKNNIAIGGDINIVKTKINGIFLSYYLNIVARNMIASFAQGVSVVHLYHSQLKKIFISTPPIKEQEKIAEIITTWDVAITKQEELIKAKEQLKKGLMQKLLSGKVRFAGFTDDWEEVRLGEICKITTGKLNANAMVENGQYTFFTCAKEPYKIDEFAFDTVALLVSGNGANVGYIHYFTGKFNAYQRTYVLDGFEHNIFFIKYLLDEYFSLQIFREKNDGNTPYITLPTLTKMKLQLPLLLEQKKINEVLSNADNEIDLLKKEFEELKLQKKGLMQKLLTGQVRVKT